MSNIQQVYGILGTQDEKGYQAKLAVVATVQQVKAVEYSQKSGKPGQSVFLRDNFGTEAWVKIQGKFDALTAQNIGQTYEFLIWPFKPDTSPKAYLYAWLQRAVGQQSVPQSAPQASYTPPQATTAPNTGKTPKDTSIERQAVVKAVCEVAARRESMNVGDIIEWAGHLHKWIETGQVSMDVTHCPTDPPQDWDESDDNIPI